MKLGSLSTVAVAVLYFTAYLGCYTYQTSSILNAVTNILQVILIWQIVQEPSRNKLAGIVCVLIGLATAYFSGSNGSAGSLATYLMTTFHLSPQSAEVAVFVIRKSIHLTAYGMLAATFVIYWKPEKHFWTVGIFWPLVHAILDETKQTHIVNRTGSALDVGIDTIGAIIGLILVRTCVQREKIRQCLKSS